MSQFEKSIEARVKHELKVLMGCLSDTTIKLLIADLKQWEGPAPRLASEALAGWLADQRFVKPGPMAHEGVSDAKG